MTNVFKVLGQQKPGAASMTTLYTVPAATSAIVSTVTACNQSAVPTSIRLSVDVAAAGDDAKDYYAYDTPIGAFETLTFTLGITAAETDLLRCWCTLATVSFAAFGQEIS
jgi:hypothetical protein